MDEDRHTNRGFLVRAPDELRDEFDAAVAAVGSDRNSMVRQLMAWFAGREDDPPDRPQRSEAGPRFS